MEVLTKLNAFFEERTEDKTVRVNEKYEGFRPANRYHPQPLYLEETEPQNVEER